LDEALRLLFKLVNEDTHHDFNLVLFLREDLNQSKVLVAESKPEEPVLVARTFFEGELGLERISGESVLLRSTMKRLKSEKAIIIPST